MLEVINKISAYVEVSLEKSTTIALVLFIGIIGLTIITGYYFLTKNNKKKK
ncbi:MAG: hypothetical protein BWX74_00771 [Tenericutes bacterium ADurb.Bin087]|nr:MAG: hypothetical protein BWX74_00771 [Tenericutes bacterium ADurb.Bin087]